MSVRPSTMQVPPPKDWQDFERNMRDLFEAHWHSTATMHGRTGQPQNGVDIYGQPNGNGAYHGVQCKGHDGNLGAAVTEAELQAEVKKARGFKPRLAHFILATTAARDAKIQAVVRRLNERKRKPFTVNVLFWDDILALYDQHEDVLKRHYRFVAPGPDRLHQLRPPLADFTGREAELADLLAHMDQGVTISGVQGMGGVGKTELAYVLADRLKGKYPDAQLYLDLKGTSPEPLLPAEVLTRIVHSFHPDAKLPDDLAELKNLYQSVLNGKRALLLMDNAAGPEQLHPLCPPPAGSVLLVTSRVHFTLPGLYTEDLNTLPPDKACELLQAICPRIGDAAGEVARLCGYLPLALRLAGSALSCSTLAPADFVARLRDERNRLGELDKGAPIAGEVEVTASLALSEALLPEPLRQRWYMLAVFPGDFDVVAPAAVWQAERNDAQDALDALYRYSVLEWNQETRRFRLHDLVRAFLHQRLVHALPPNDELTAARRFVEYNVAFAAVASAVLEQKDGYISGLALFDAESTNIQAAFAVSADRAAAQPWANDAITQLAAGCGHCLALRLHGQARVRWLTAGLEAAQRAKNRQAEGVILGNLGLAYAALGDARQATKFHEWALAVGREIGDRHAEVAHLGNLGLAHAALGDVRRAVEFYYQGLVIAREIGDRRGEGAVLGDLGAACAVLGDTRKAIEFYEQRFTIAREVGNRHGEGATLCNLGLAYAALGDTRKAIEFYEQALVIVREIGDRRGEGNVLGDLGIAYKNLGDARKGIEYHQQALAIDREISDRRGEGADLGNLGLAYAALGDTRKAIEFYEQQLVIVREIGDRAGEAHASWNMGLAYGKLGDPARAVELMQVYVDFEREIGHADAERHAAYLATLRAQLK